MAQKTLPALILSIASSDENRALVAVVFPEEKISWVRLVDGDGS